MKRIIALTLLLALLLCGCGNAAPAETTAAPTEATTEPTTEPTTVPTEPPVYYNPLNGEILDAPFTGRLHAHTISNMAENMPHVNLVKADVVMEMYANMNNIVRCLALYSDIASVEAIGSTRSTRPIFNDICQHYDLILSHAGGSDTALSDATNRGVEHFNIEAWEVQEVVTTSYRDKEYRRSLENSLFGIGSGIKAYAEAQGWPMEMERDYGFRFAEDGNGTPVDGEWADRIDLTFVYKQAKKDTDMVYDRELGKYVWHQYNKEMTDQITGEKEAFTNVIYMQTNITNNGIYHAADFVAGGTGYYANGGKIIPITWTCADEDSAFEFFTQNGEPLLMGQGNTYIAICTPESPITWEGSAPVEETVPAETVMEPAAVEAVAEAAAEPAPAEVVVDETMLEEAGG